MDPAHRKFTVEDAQELCQRYKVKFSIELAQDAHSIFYCFGPIKWEIQIGRDFTTEAYYEVVQRLAATFPELVLPNYQPKYLIEKGSPLSDRLNDYHKLLAENEMLRKKMAEMDMVNRELNATVRSLMPKGPADAGPPRRPTSGDALKILNENYGRHHHRYENEDLNCGMDRHGPGRDVPVGTPL